MLNNSIRRINGIQFGLWNPKEIIDYAVCEILNIDLYSRDGPKPNGLFDLRLGTVDPQFPCYTCHESIQTCPGHFGYINLVKPVYLPHFIDSVKRLLTIICTECSNPLISLGAKGKNQNKFNQAYALCKDKQVCYECGAIQPKVTNDHMNIYLTHSNAGQSVKEKTHLTPEDCLTIFKKINDADLEKLGFSTICRPEWMIFSVVPVAPPCVRPSVFHDTGTRSENDLTYKYLEILKCNIALKNEIQRFKQQFHELKQKTPKDDKYQEIIDTFKAEKEKNIEKRFEHLQTHVTTIINNKIPGITSKNRSGRPFKCFSDRLASKSGRIRWNLMGKRTDFSSRSVITPDPALGIDELGVPLWIAMKLTVKEPVNQFNRAYLQEMVLNGSNKYPGALYIIKHGKKRYNLEFAPKKLAELRAITNLTEQEKKMLTHWESLMTVEYGDQVERQMIGSNTEFECEGQTGFYKPQSDFVIFNRQPSLHKQSMMGHKVRILPFETLS